MMRWSWNRTGRVRQFANADKTKGSGVFSRVKIRLCHGLGQIIHPVTSVSPRLRSWRVLYFFFDEVEFGLGFERKAAAASRDKSHVGTFQFQASPKEDQSCL